jgi:glycosyltransferase involved in cell wall biosynthesis
MGRCTHTEILEAMRSWSAGIVPLMDAPLMAGALPSKMFEIMAAGLPVILSAPRGEASELIAAAEAGVWAPPEDAPALAAAVRRLASDADLRRRLGRNGRRFVQEHFDREQIARRFVHFLEQRGWMDAASRPVGEPGSGPVKAGE